MVRCIVKQCLTCYRQRGEPNAPLMGNLPDHRVNPQRTILVSGVDYTGPVLLRNMRGRKQSRYKGCIVIFVCFGTKNIHLEPMSDETTASLLSALKRFVSRRGLTRDICSDCGRNFEIVNRELKQILKTNVYNGNSDMISSYMSSHNINWHFNPPSVRHFGSEKRE